MIEISQATAEDFLQIAGMAPPHSFQGYCIRQDGKCVAIGGIFIADGQFVMFTDFACPVGKKYVIKAARMVMELAKKKHAPVLAVRDPDRPTSHSLLTHFGFQPLMDSPAGEVYVWQ